MGHNDEKRRIHPTQKPIDVGVWFLKHFSGEESIIADIYLGSGSTLIASEKTKRICYGMELDPRYVDTIVERYCQYTGNRKIKKNGIDIDWTSNKEGV